MGNNGSNTNIFISGKDRKAVKLPMHGLDSGGNLYEADNISLLKNGKRILPVMGEFHFSRYEADGWEDELLKMRAGGIQIAATYVFWIHHEEKKEEWNFEGSRNLREFLNICRRISMPVWLRIGPWAHGECRNGGFPDWVQHSGTFTARTNEPDYLKEVKRWFTKLGELAQGMMCKDGGPIIGIQLENEYGHCGGTTDPAEGKRHMRILKEMAVEAGFSVPYYSVTGWNGAHVAEGEMLPVLGGYVDAPWHNNMEEMPASENFLFASYRNDENIGSDWEKKKELTESFDIDANPFLTAELGGGLQVTSHRRTYPWPEDIEASALCMLGGGAGLIGYYMYHGGINPDGKYTSLNESQASGGYTTVPEKSYDFQACIRESGEINESFGKLKKIHLLLADYGEDLAGAELYFPDVLPQSPEDMQTLRMTVRWNDKSKTGFLFFNNHQRKRLMQDHEDFDVTLIFGDMKIKIAHLYLRSSECGIIPVNLGLEDTVLKQTNAFLLCRLGKRTFFYSDLDKPYFNLERESRWVTVISGKCAERAFRMADGLYITEQIRSCIIEQNGDKYLLTKEEKEELTVYREDGAVEVIPVICKKKHVAVETIFLKEKTDADGGVEWREYRVCLGEIPKDEINQLYLAVDYKGDRAEVYQNNKLVDDWFTTGERWHIALKRFCYPRELIIRIYSSSRPIYCTYGEIVYYDIPVEEGCEVIDAAAIPEYKVKI